MDESRVPETDDQKASRESATEGQRGFKENCSSIRGAIERIKVTVLMLKCHSEFQEDEAPVGQQGQMQANIQLAFRHLEDARMRLGKAIQAFDGG